jgi:RNA polymerase sigma factor (sigma-70 family)
VALRVDDVDIARDRLLVERFQAGDHDAFEELYRRYHDRLQRFCLKRLGDTHAAEEVAQESFTRALTALPELGGELRFYPWVSVIASRLCVDHFRRQARSEPFADPNPGTVDGGQEDRIIDAVDASLVVAALARLAPRHQDVLHLREVEGWSYQHIATHYGITVGAVETLLFRARRALRREFRIIDGAGLAAIPLLGRAIQFAGRVRTRLPPWVPATPSVTTFAAAATATAAAVAIAVAPSWAPARAALPPASNPAHVQVAPGHGAAGAAGANGQPATAGAAGPAAPGSTGAAGAAVPPDTAAGTAPLVQGTGTLDSVTVPSSALGVTGTTADVPPVITVPSGGGPDIVGPTVGQVTGIVPPALPLPLPSIVPNAVPPVSVPVVPLTLPPLGIGDPLVGAVTTAPGTADSLVGGLLHR